MDKQLVGANWRGGAVRPQHDEPLAAMARRMEATQRILLARLEQCLRDSAVWLEKQPPDAARKP